MNKHDKSAKRATRLETSRAKRMGERESRALTPERVRPESWPTETVFYRDEEDVLRQKQVLKPLMCNRCRGKHVGFCAGRRRR